MARGSGRLIRKAFAFLRRTRRRSRSPQSAPSVPAGAPRPAGPFQPRPVFRDRHGFLTDGKYRVSASKNLRHTHGDASPDRSVFHAGTDVERLTLDAAQYADQADLWDPLDPTKAKVPFDRDVGIHRRTGAPTNVVNVYRKIRTGTVHISPGSRRD
jgi:hypothetical protein